MADSLGGPNTWTLAGSRGGLRAGAYRRSRLEWLPSVVTGSVRAIDAFVILVAAFVAHSIYLDALTDDREDMYVVLIACAAVLQLNIFHFAGAYQFKRLANVGAQIARSLMALTLLFVLLLTVLYFTKLSADTSRGWMALWFAFSATGLVVARVGVSAVMRKWFREGLLARRVAIVGSGRPADRLADYLARFGNAQVHFVGIFDDRLATRESDLVHRPEGTIDQLCRLARTQQIDAIILAMPQISEARLAKIMDKLKSLPVDIRLCRDTLEFCLPQSSYEFVGIVPMLRLYDRPVSGWDHLLKEIEDRVLSSLLIVGLAPVFAAIALAIKLNSKGPVFFRQKRYGFNNQLITVWKFRTMYTEMTDANADKLATRDDPRITRVGRFLRTTSLDELPQLFNVFLGDMSLVGPRPHAISAKAAGQLYEDVVAEYALRHRVKPGMTGWAQVNGWRGETDTIEKIRGRVNCDLFYIDNWSILLDLRILVMTAWAIFQRENAY